MSGYRNFYREKVGEYPIWQVVTCPLLTKTTRGQLSGGSKAPAEWRIWAACGDGFVRGYLVREKSVDNQENVLDASACTCTCTHILTGQSKSTTAVIGCSQVKLARNYVGDDKMAGDLLIISMDLTGKVRIWCMPEDLDDQEGGNDTLDPQRVQPIQEFVVPNATGTNIQVLPPRISGVGDVMIAVPRLDGTIAIMAVGIVTPKTTGNGDKAPTAAGTIIDVWSKAGSIAMSSDWHPTKKSMVVGRQDGLVEILGEKPHRLIFHEAPVRAVAFTPDANLLVTASDDGMLAVWDLGRTIPALVHHVVQAHATWILSVTALEDSRRFLTCGADRKLHVWSASQMHQSVHSFTCDDTVWSINHCTTTTIQRRAVANAPLIPPRLVSGSEEGRLQIYSLEA